MRTLFRRHPELRLTALEGEGVVLHLGARRYFTVTATGLTILEALAEPKTFEQLVDAILAEYEVDRARAESSAREFLDHCVEATLIIEEAR